MPHPFSTELTWNHAEETYGMMMGNFNQNPYGVGFKGLN